MKKFIKKTFVLSAAFLVLFSCNNDDDVTTPQVVNKIELLGQTAAPEGVTVDQRNGIVYTGSILDGSVQKTENGVSQYLVSQGNNTLLPNVLGLSVDEQNNRLWVCSTNFFGAPQSRISVIDLGNGNELVSFDNTDMGTSSDFIPFFNDVVLDNQGNAFITNTVTPAILKVSSDLSSASVFTTNFPELASGTSYSLNGIEVTNDEKYLIAVTFSSSQTEIADIFRIEITNGNVTKVNWTENGSTNFSSRGGDGIAFISTSELLCVSSSSLVNIKFNEDYTEAVISDVSTGTDVESDLSGIATLGVYNNKVYTSNAQVGTIIAGGTPETPYTVIEIPMSLINL